MGSLLDYLESYGKSGHARTPETADHSRLVRGMSNDIHRRLRKPVTFPVYTYVVLQGSTRLIGEVDVVLVSPKEDYLALVEAKTIMSNGKSRRSQANWQSNSQLKRAYDFFVERFGIGPELFSYLKNASGAYEFRNVVPDIESTFKLLQSSRSS